jgi:hypothetical protein
VPVDAAKLKQLIAEALGSSPFSISGAKLSSPPITNLLSTHLGADALELTGAEKLSETDASVVIKGKLVGKLHGIGGLTVEATFSTDGTTPQLAATLTDLPTGWVPSQAFPALRDGFAGELGFSACKLLLDSGGSLAMPAGYPGHFGFPDLPQGTVETGLGLSATLSPPPGGDGLTWLMGATSWEVSGPIGLFGGLPLLCLSSQPGTGLEFGGYRFPFSVSLATFPVVVPGGSPTAVRSLLQLDAEVDKEVGGKPLKLPFVARVGSGDSTLVDVASDLPPKTGITVDQLAGLLAGGTTSGQLPSTGIPALDDIALQRVHLLFAPAAKRLVSAGVAVGYVSPPPWSPLGGIFSVDQIILGLEYVPAASPSMSTQMSARFELGGGYLDATIDLPEVTFAAELEPGQRIDIAELVKSAAGDSISMGEEIACTALKLWGDIPGGSYGFEATVADDWTFKLGTVPLALTEVGFAIEYDSSAGLGGELVATFMIAGCRLYASAGYHKQSGWAFSGGTVEPVAIDVDHLLGEVDKLFGLPLPAGTTPAQIKVENLNIDYATGTSHFELKSLVDLEVAGTKLDLGIEIASDADGKRFHGYLWFEENVFTLDFTDDQSKVVSASWSEEPEAPPLTFETIAKALGLPLPQLPKEIDVEFTGATLTYDFDSETLRLTIDTKSGGHALLAAVPDGSGGHQLVLGVGLGGELSLSQLPLVGPELSGAEKLAITGLRAFATTSPLPEAAATKFNQLAPPSPLPLPEKGLPGDVTLAAELCIGNEEKPLALSAGGSKSAQPQAELEPQAEFELPQAALEPARSLAVQGTGSSAPPATLWLPVQRSFGPVTVSQVGVRYAAGAVWFEVSGSLAAGPASLELIGLGFGVPLAEPEHVRFGLDGLGVGYSQPPLEIAGSLTNLSPPDGSSLEFQGGLVIEAESFTLEAFGYYGNGGDGSGNRFNSLFVFLEGGAEIGGPPFFFVTGFAAGFGYNSSLALPPVEKVASFPMIAALPDAPNPEPAALGGPNPTPLTVLNTLTSANPPWVAPTRGEFWGAAGITFTTFELVKSQALLVVEAGDKLLISLLGLSTARFPQEGPDVYAQVELELEARLDPGAGEFWVEAILAPSSFVIDPACHLTGGFAFCTWFGPSKQAGDFVLTLGGYHPAFAPPSYYPTVPRLGFSWQLGGAVTVSGKAYFALTPSAFMLGGELDVTFQSGNLRAWLTAGADVILHWSPFWFDAHIWVSIGASYRLDLWFTTVTLSVSIGADLRLWGPPTGGTVTVNWYVIEFTIPFGSRGPRTEVSSWKTVGKLLPASSISISAVSGLTAPAAVSAGGDAGEPWVVRGGSFSFATATPVPASLLKVGSGTYEKAFPSLDVRPLAATGVASTHALTITDAANPKDDVSGAFEVKPVTAAVPASLWGAPADTAKVPSAAGQLVEGQAVGLELTVKPPEEGASAGAIEVAGVLAHQELNRAGAVLPLAAGEPKGPTAEVSAVALETMTGASGIASGSAIAARKSLVDGLATAGVVVAPGANPSNFSGQAGTYLTAEPMLAVPA